MALRCPPISSIQACMQACKSLPPKLETRNSKLSIHPPSPLSVAISPDLHLDIADLHLFSWQLAVGSWQRVGRKEDFGLTQVPRFPGFQVPKFPSSQVLSTHITSS
ncbi:hypothetical protein BofuT4_P016270.1 [Botrytis cinerea T4]|uniref:Uncharacterized protein n=1 Tax=Botryotinia fuckeliana (strain T4) TaxID=999810 RepID=G2YHY4_BOTF4|nr:hypothetical protein BofuT4_P016270.1 [Botrytis cinerea T4]